MKAILLAYERERRGINQIDFAAAAGIAKPTLVDIEKGRLEITPKQYNELVDLAERMAQPATDTVR